MKPAALAAATLGFVLSGCGLKGPLALPEKSGPVTIHPAPTATTPTAPTPTVPATSAAPAAETVEAPSRESVESSRPSPDSSAPEPQRD